MIAAHELGLVDRLELRRTVVRMSAPNVDLLRDNPLGKIPTLVLDDGAIIVDSGVICDYFDSLAGGGALIPRSGAERWRELSRHAMLTGWLDILILWRNERDKPPDKQTAAWLAGFDLKTRATLNRFEGDIDPISDAPLRLSQITLGCCLSYLDFRFATIDWRRENAQLAAWHNGFRQRASAKATEIVDDS